MRARCPHCQTVLEAGDAEAGTVIRCTGCGRPVRLPASAAEPAPGPIEGRRRQPPTPPTADEPPDEAEAEIRASLPGHFPAEAKDLGRPRFRVERAALPQNALKPAFLALVCCIPSSLCIVGSNSFLGVLAGILAVAGLVGFAVWWITRELGKTRIYAVVYTDGFVVARGGRFAVWRWADVVTLNFQNYEVTSYFYFIQKSRLLTTFYRLRHRDGAAFQFWSSRGPRAAQFGLLAVERTLALMLPAARARLRAGDPVEFGPFRIEPTGLAFRGHSVPWSEVGPMSIRKGNVVIEGLGANGGPAVASLEAVDNGHVFLTLVQEKLGPERED